MGITGNTQDPIDTVAHERKGYIGGSSFEIIDDGVGVTGAARAFLVKIRGDSGSDESLTMRRMLMPVMILASLLASR